MRLQRCLWRNRYAAVFAGLALPALINSAWAESTDFLDGITLELPPFPSMRGSLYDTASDQVLLAATADSTSADPGPVRLAQATDAAPAAAGAPAAGDQPAATPAPAPGATVPAAIPVPMASLIDGLDTESPYSELLSLGSALGGPAWVFVPRVGIAEYLTDNAGHTQTNRRAAAYTHLRASIAARGDTPRIQAGLALSVRYRFGFGGAGSHNNGFATIGSGAAHTIAIQDLLFFDVNGAAREIQRIGYGDVNTEILNRNETTQIYTATASPDVKWRVGSIGTSDLRYAYSHIWVERNTGPIVTTNGVLGSLTDGTVQFGRYDFHMPESILPRLTSDITAYAADHDIQGRVGRFKRAAGELINEYQISDTISGIVTGGYESLNSPRFPLASGQGALWDVGGRWRPNVDSSVLLLWGRQDLKTSVRGEATYQITPETSVYARYINGITTSQGALLSGSNSSFFGADDEGPLTTVGYEDDNTLSTLNGGNFGFSGFGSGGGGFGGTGGFPISGADNFSAHQNGIFRRKLLALDVINQFGEDRVTFRVYHAERESLTGSNFIDGVLNLTPGITPVGNLNSTGARLSWTRDFQENLPVTVMAGWRDNSINQGQSWSLSGFATYRFAGTLSARLRIDSIYHQEAKGRSFYVDVVSISLTKTFE